MPVTLGLRPPDDAGEEEADGLVLEDACVLIDWVMLGVWLTLASDAAVPEALLEGVPVAAVLTVGLADGDKAALADTADDGEAATELDCDMELDACTVELALGLSLTDGATEMDADPLVLGEAAALTDGDDEGVTLVLTDAPTVAEADGDAVALATLLKLALGEGDGSTLEEADVEGVRATEAVCDVDCEAPGLTDMLALPVTDADREGDTLVLGVDVALIEGAMLVVALEVTDAPADVDTVGEEEVLVAAVTLALGDSDAMVLPDAESDDDATTEGV